MLLSIIIIVSNYNYSLIIAIDGIAHVIDDTDLYYLFA